MKTIKIPLELQQMYKIFKENGFEAYLVGGAVRDVLRGKNAADWDIATNATPEQVMAIFHKVIPTGIEHGTVTVLFKQKQFEVTTFRTEKDYTDGRHPDHVEYTSKIEEDLSRRDFTMNAIAVSLEDGKIVDPFDGKKDIQKKIITTVGNPLDRFNEDGLRPIRAIRFASQLGFEIKKETLEAIPLSLEKTKTISIERFRDEFCKILKSEKPSIGLNLLKDTGILDIFIPELATCEKVEQADCRGVHKFDVLDHLFFACDGAPKDKFLVRVAALFHDIGKPATKISKIREDGELIHTFFGHENKSADITQEILNRLKFPKVESSYICHLIKNHMFHYESTWTDAAIRRFLARVTPEAVEDLFDLRIADVYGMTNTEPCLKNSLWSQNLIEFKDRIENIESESMALTLKDLAINGKDLIKEGFSPGKYLGMILNELLETVLDDPNQNSYDKLLNIAKNIAKKDGALI